MNRRGFLKSGIALGAMAGVMMAPQFAFGAGDTIKVGILHSLVRHHGNQRNDAERRDVDVDRTTKRQGRLARKKA